MIKFLDVTIIKKDYWYYKPIFSGWYLKFLSAHPTSQKKGIVFEVIDRAILLFESKFYQKKH